MLRRLLHEDDGQDIVEYALLAALIGVSAALIWQQIATDLGTVYTNTVAPTGPVQTLSACTPNPGGGGCP